jgi:hypothetical protein
VTATPVSSATLPAPAGTPADWCARDAADAASAFAVTSDAGLSADNAARRHACDRPAEKPRSGLTQKTLIASNPTTATQA